MPLNDSNPLPLITLSLHVFLAEAPHVVDQRQARPVGITEFLIMIVLCHYVLDGFLVQLVTETDFTSLYSLRNETGLFLFLFFCLFFF